MHIPTGFLEGFETSSDNRVLVSSNFQQPLFVELLKTKLNTVLAMPTTGTGKVPCTYKYLH